LAVLVLVACGGAGLAVHTEKPQDQAPRSQLPGQTQGPVQRPELFSPADEELLPWVPALDERLAALDGRVTDLSSAATDLLGALFSLNPEAAVGAADAGDAAGAATATALEDATVLRDDAVAQEWRLSPPNRERLALFDAAVESSRGLAEAWSSVSADARLAAGVLQPLAVHDALLAEATTAGRESRWRDAVEALDAAAGPLAEASAAVERLPATLDVPRMWSLVAAYGEYEEALRALYQRIDRTDSVSGPAVAELLATVEQRQAGVPMDRLALGEVVVDALGQALTESIVAMEQAKADIFDALPGEELDTPDEEIEPGAVE
jgi:hypothetical protein